MSPRRRKPTTQGAKVPTGLPYGTGAELANAQRQIPLPGPGARPQAHLSPASSSAPAAGEAMPAAQDPMAAAVQAAALVDPGGGLLGPSARTDEPVTAGLRVGAGPGPEVLPPPSFGYGAGDPVMAELVAAYRRFPDSDLGDVIARLRAMRGR